MPLVRRVGHPAVKTVLKHHSHALDGGGIGLRGQDRYQIASVRVSHWRSSRWDWVQDRYAQLVAGATHKEDVAFRPVEQALSPELLLARLAEVMECEPEQFRTLPTGSRTVPLPPTS